MTTTNSNPLFPLLADLVVLTGHTFRSTDTYEILAYADSSLADEEVAAGATIRPATSDDLGIWHINEDAVRLLNECGYVVLSFEDETGQALPWAY